jgi:hypothetical protein
MRVIVKDVITTSPLNHPSGERCVTLTLASPEHERREAIGVTPKGVIVEAGDEIEIGMLGVSETTSSGITYKNYQFDRAVSIERKQVLEPISIVATITKVNLRLPPRFNIYSKMAMEISAQGFSSVSGNVAANLIIERGMRCEFTGFRSSFNGRQTLDLIYGMTDILEREAHDPAAIIAHKVSKTLNKTHIETVRNNSATIGRNGLSTILRY